VLLQVVVATTEATGWRWAAPAAVGTAAADHARQAVRRRHRPRALATAAVGACQAPVQIYKRPPPFLACAEPRTRCDQVGWPRTNTRACLLGCAGCLNITIESTGTCALN